MLLLHEWYDTCWQHVCMCVFIIHVVTLNWTFLYIFTIIDFIKYVLFNNGIACFTTFFQLRAMRFSPSWRICPPILANRQKKHLTKMNLNLNCYLVFKSHFTIVTACQLLNLSRFLRHKRTMNYRHQLPPHALPLWNSLWNIFGKQNALISTLSTPSLSRFVECNKHSAPSL